MQRVGIQICLLLHILGITYTEGLLSIQDLPPMPQSMQAKLPGSKSYPFFTSLNKIQS